VYVIALLACDWLFKSFKSNILQELMLFYILSSWDEKRGRLVVGRLWFDSLVESDQNTLKVGIHSVI